MGGTFATYQPDPLSKEHLDQIDRFEEWLRAGGFVPGFRHSDPPNRR